MLRFPVYLCLVLLSHAICLPAAEKHATVPVSKLTFNKDIAPIIFENCASCHRAGEAAPFPLTNYLEVKARGKLIAAVTKSRYMPPWHAAPADVEYRDERRLSDDQITKIQSWVGQSMPQGDPANLPALPRFSPGWQLGKPDLILQMPEPYEIPADGPDIYRTFAIPVDIPEDKWVRAVEFRPQARQSSHHAFFVIDTSGQSMAMERGEPGVGFSGTALFVRFRSWGARELFRSGSVGGGNSFGGWAVGSSPRALPDGLAYKLPKKSSFVIQEHFHPSGKPEVEQAQVGLYFADGPPKRTLVGLLMPYAYGRYADMNIPPGDKTYTIRDSFTTPVDVEVYSVGGHAHYLGKEMKVTVRLPDGSSKKLLWIDRWDFDWQDLYFFRKPLSLPAGTTFDVVMTYDNSAENPFNPHNPPRPVRWGTESEDEMAGMSIAVVPRREADLPKLEEARNAAAQHSVSQARATMLKRYDKDGDGQLSPDERRTMQIDRRKARNQND